ncbi:hypothetical protein SAMN04487880_1183 [Marinobacter sp. es.042]|nr:hypothetical protein SAMN04487880_1183 [Marinobacter sp. es.042]
MEKPFSFRAKRHLKYVKNSDTPSVCGDFGPNKAMTENQSIDLILQV